MRKLDRTPATLGEKLRALRRGQAVSLEMIEARTNIQRSYLEALEAGDYDKLPAPLYARNFLRAYARELGADEHYFIELYEEECGKCDLVDPMRVPRQRVRSMRFFIGNHLVKFGALAGILFIIGGYLGWQIVTLTSAPEITLFSPQNEFKTEKGVLLVEGLIEDEATVTINGEPVVVDVDRSFSAFVDLQKGVNTIRVEAQRRYSKTAVIERTVLYNPDVFSQALDK